MTVVVLDASPMVGVPLHRAVPVLHEPDIGHYPEFRQFFIDTFAPKSGGLQPPGYLKVEGRPYQVVFVGRSGRPFPAGVEIEALVPGLEPVDDIQVDADLWVILKWLLSGVGGRWSARDLVLTGKILRISAAVNEIS
jgi:hypothetical protein